MPVDSPVVVVAGVSSSGKSTIGVALAKRIGARFIDADDFHPPENVRKMASGVPLVDEDRWPWLDRLNRELREAAARGEKVVLACSALKEAYRERLAAGVDGFRLVLLTGSRELLASRAAARKHRYMPPSLLDSQLDTLEPLAPGTGWEVDVTPPVDEIVESLAQRLATPSGADCSLVEPGR
jgi:carbohydrate kinase (thermoresistant glucokinase family)